MPSGQLTELEVLPVCSEAGWETYDVTDDERDLQEEYDIDDDYNYITNILEKEVADLNPDLATTTIHRYCDEIIEKTEQPEEAENPVKPGLVDWLKHGYPADDPVVDRVRLVDTEQPEKNNWVAVQGLPATPDHQNTPTVTGFLNGIPIIVLLNHPDAPRNLPNIFTGKKSLTPALFNVAASKDGVDYAPPGAHPLEYDTWKPYLEIGNQLDDLLSKDVLIDLLMFTYFERHTSEVKEILPRFHQYKTVLDLSEGLQRNYFSGTQLVRHSEGTGKTVSMVFAALALTEKTDSEVQVVVVVRSSRQRKVVRRAFASREQPRFEDVETAHRLEKILGETGSKVLLVDSETLDGIETPLHTTVETVVLEEDYPVTDIADVDTPRPNQENNYVRFLGFPNDAVDAEEERRCFGYLHDLSIEDAYERGLLTSVEFQHKVDETSADLWNLYQQYSGPSAHSLEEHRKVREYLRARANEIVEHYTSELQDGGWKGMVVASTTEAAALYGQELTKLLHPKTVEVIVDARNGESSLVDAYHKSPEEVHQVLDDFERSDSDTSILVLSEPEYAEFHAAELKAIYLDSNLEEAPLAKVLTRVNRAAPDKDTGVVIDYSGSLVNNDRYTDYHVETYGRS